MRLSEDTVFMLAKLGDQQATNLIVWFYDGHRDAYLATTLDGWLCASYAHIVYAPVLVIPPECTDPTCFGASRGCEGHS